MLHSGENSIKFDLFEITIGYIEYTGFHFTGIITDMHRAKNIRYL